MKQGRTIANKQGKQLEGFVKTILEEQEYIFIPKNKFIVASRALSQKKYTQELNICNSIYEHKINADFTIFNHNNNEKYIIIECKSQTSSGSVDEKYPYFYENIKLEYPYKTIIVLNAPKAKKGAVKWLKAQERLNKNLLNIFEFSEFRLWATKNLGS